MRYTRRAAADHRRGVVVDRQPHQSQIMVDRRQRTFTRTLRRAGQLSPLVLLSVLGLLCSMAAPAMAETECASSPNPVVCENAKPGDPPSDWQVNGVGSSSIQGYGTSMSVNVGQTESFKINTPASSYHIDILRLGYYGGDGARLIASNIKPTASLPQKQPACLTNSSTGLIDCGNWGVSASWAVPGNAVSGVYIAHLVRNDNGEESQIPFVVRNDASHSEILLQTSDATWEAYNDWGGNSLYTCTVACPPGEPEAYKAAYSVSYNRPWEGSFEVDGGASYLYYAEYQMIYWLEKNGYNASYTSGSEVDNQGSLLKNHKVFVSSGHDEYWSEGQRSNVESALSAGVNLAFFSGNEMFWKTRWGPSTEGSNTPYRTLTSYKETHFNAPVDPQDPPTWTGSWRDPRFSPPANGGKPENALTGQDFLVNAGTADITVPSQYGKERLWRSTAASTLKSGQSLTLAPGSGTLGYEWDEDVDNGFRPAGEFDLSSTTVSGLQTFKDYGSTVAENTTATHHLTLYKAPSGALVFGAGTVQWSWGLANINAWESETTEPANKPADPNLEQATVNLFGDMGAQPGSLSTGLVAATKSTDTTAPTSTITSPVQGATLQDGAQTTVTGKATDAGGGVVAGVEVSTDGGSTWHPATLSTPAEQSVSWSYTWAAHGNPTTTIKSRAVDDSANLEKPSTGITVNVSCPCSIWGSAVTPPTPDSGDSASLELGLKFTSDKFGTVTGVRFYKSALNTGTHVGSLWTASGTLLASATFTGETASGWQQVNFSTPVQISANTTYVVAYLAPNGHYADDPYYFYTPPAVGGNQLNSPPLNAVPASDTTSNGLFAYSSSSAFPTSTFNAANYWVDPVFSPAATPGQVTGVSATPNAGAATVSWTAPSSGGVVATYTVTPYIGSTAQTATTVTGSPPETSVTIIGLKPGTAYTFTVQASNPNGSGPVSAHSNSVTPPAVAPPSPPTGVSATPATKQALVSWKTPALEGGSPITGYTVTPYIGSTAQTPIKVSASILSTAVTGLTNGTSYTFKVAATNSVGTGEQSQASSAVTPQDTIFEFATPSTVDTGDTSSVELGVKFTAEVSGTVTGVRFYKAATNTGTHIGSLWSATGTLLASATFSNESASGWQQVTFATPVSITAGTTYVAGYLAPSGHYSATSSAFGSAEVANRPLHAPANSTSANGLYTYSSSSVFPTSSFNATNYYVDVLFAPTPPTGPPSSPTAVSAAAAASKAQVSWTAPSSEGGGPITGYTVTPFIGSTAQAPVNVGPATTSTTLTSLTNGTSYTFKVTATNSVGTSQQSLASGAVTPQDTIFEFTTPSAIDSGDASSVELGVKFAASENGLVTGIRFYKSQANTGTHIGSLWNASGTLLASATFTNEASAGWTQVTFSSPVTIKSGTTYVAAYLAPSGHYSATSTAFGTAGVSNPPLQALANATSADGVYAYSSTSIFPTNSFNATNYWVDVLFTPIPPVGVPSQPTAVSAAAAAGKAQVSWSSPSNEGGGKITGYTVTPYIGTKAQTPLTVEASTTSATLTGLTNNTSYTFKVAATNSAGTSEQSPASSAVVPQNTIFEFTPPAVLDSGDSTSIELGVKFAASENGSVTGIRFYKSQANTGTHIGSLWNASGTLLASATFTNEASAGWTQVTFSSPVTIKAGTTYVAGYFAPNGHYSATSSAFGSTGVSNPPLQALANETSSNGVYSYGSASTFPTNSFNATNYYVDVLFTPATPSAPEAPEGIAATVATDQAQVSWTTPGNDGSPITGYTITPYIGAAAQTPVKVGASVNSALLTGLTNGTSYTFTVLATNAIGNGEQSQHSAAATPRDTIFDFIKPEAVDSGDRSSIELGVKFAASENGSVTGVRFYKSPANTGTHVGSLWSASGTLLASATFTNETEAGWQQVTFAEPVAITAGTTYVAAYLAPNGHYSATSTAFGTVGVSNPPLQALVNEASSENGLYAYDTTSAFPTNSFNAANYWVDLMFAPGP
jgi:Domain of unknown function (DUF4082)/Fibronectin type III domain/Bacterial Ig domain